MSDDSQRAFGDLLSEHLGAILAGINPNCSITLFIRRNDIQGDVGWAITTETNPNPKEMGMALEKCLELIIPQPVLGKDLAQAILDTRDGKHKN